MSQTTVLIEKETREKLARLKFSERETYDEVLNKLIELVPSGDNEGEYSDEFRASLLRGLGDIRHGRTVSLETVKKRVGLK